MKRILYIIGALGLMFSSCAKSEMPQEGGAVVNFTASEPMSRVSEDGLEWVGSDMIGVIQNNGDIVKFNYNSATGAMNIADKSNQIYAKVNATYTAYYDAKSDLTNNVFPADLTAQSTTAIKPLLWAKAEEQSGADVTLEFVHQYSRLEFTLIAGTGVDLSDISSAKLVGANAKGSFNVWSGEWSDITSADIALKVKDKKIVAYALAKEDVNGNVELVITADSKEYTTTIATEKWESGKKYLYNVTVGAAAE